MISFEMVGKEAHTVLTVPYNKTSKFYSFMGVFTMSAVTLTTGMLTVLSVASPFGGQGQKRHCAETLCPCAKL